MRKGQMQGVKKGDGPDYLDKNEALIWSKEQGGQLIRIHLRAPETEHARHRRKYTEGDLGQDISFYFRGPQDKLHLQAQNLKLFVQLAEGVDEETWYFHFQKDDYSRWFRDVIKDSDLAKEVEALAQQADISAQQSRAMVLDLIKKRYSV
jgi:hypothetical protein